MTETNELTQEINNPENPSIPMTPAQVRKLMSEDERIRKDHVKQNKAVNENLQLEVSYYTGQADLIYQRFRAMEYYLKNREIQNAYDNAVAEDKAKLEIKNEKPASSIITV